MLSSLLETHHYNKAANCSEAATTGTEQCPYNKSRKPVVTRGFSEPTHVRETFVVATQRRGQEQARRNGRPLDPPKLYPPMKTQRGSNR